MVHNKRRTAAERAADLVTLDMLAARGVDRESIRRKLEMSSKQVETGMKQVEAEWLAKTKTDLGQQRARELAKIDQLETTAWVAWAKSLENVETTKVVADGDTKRAERTVKSQSGTVGLLRMAAWCIGTRCKILGVYAYTTPPLETVEQITKEAVHAFSAKLEFYGWTPPDWSKKLREGLEDPASSSYAPRSIDPQPVATGVEPGCVGERKSNG